MNRTLIEQIIDHEKQTKDDLKYLSDKIKLKNQKSEENNIENNEKMDFIKHTEPNYTLDKESLPCKCMICRKKREINFNNLKELYEINYKEETEKQIERDKQGIKMTTHIDYSNIEPGVAAIYEKLLYEKLKKCNYVIEVSDLFIRIKGKITIEECYDFLNFYERKGYNLLSHTDGYVLTMQKEIKVVNPS